MFPDATDQLPLSTESIELRDQILAIPRTEKPLHDAGVQVEPDLIVEMHDLSIHDPRRAIPMLKKLLKVHPHCKPFWNYLFISYNSVGQHFQANATLKELMQRHPNYLFGRISLAEKAFFENRLEQAVVYLGPDLDLRSLYPERTLFHVSEIYGYYFLAARIRARQGEILLAIGVKEAL